MRQLTIEEMKCVSGAFMSDFDSFDLDIGGFFADPFVTYYNQYGFEVDEGEFWQEAEDTYAFENDERVFSEPAHTFTAGEVITQVQFRTETHTNYFSFGGGSSGYDFAGFDNSFEEEDWIQLANNSDVMLPVENHQCSGEQMRLDIFDAFRDLINGKEDSSNKEYGAVIAYSAETDRYSLVGQDTLYGPADFVRLPHLPDGQSGDIVGVIHNHPDKRTNNFSSDEINRYPSADDWEIAEEDYIGNGADPDNFSLFIVDTEGELREFKYSERHYYENLTGSQKEDGENLPDVISKEEAVRHAQAESCSG